MKKLLLLALSAAVLPLTQSQAIRINVFVTDIDGLYLQPDGSTRVTDDYSLEWGTLDVSISEFESLTPSEQIAYILDIDNHFTSGQTIPFAANGEIDLGPAFDASLPAGMNFGEQLFTLVRNTTESELGLFAVPAISFWSLPGSELGSSDLFLEAGQPGTDPIALYGSVSGINGVLAAAPVPEPATYALIAGVMTLGLVAYRRRQKA
ncbi:MAG: PEP-CTERM sorting domain-containing protein [Verrucomicrobiota bacterium]